MSSDYVHGYVEGFKSGKREGCIETEDELRADAERDTALMRKALKALEWCEPAGIVGHGGITARKQIITALRKRLGDKA